MTSIVDRRRFLLTSLAGTLATPLAARARQAGKVYRVGILGESASDPSEARLWQGFRLGLRERGWIEGENILIESRWAEGTRFLRCLASSRGTHNPATEALHAAIDHRSAA
jgi:hypothetical protein